MRIFQKPLKGIDTLYSCRKFWGVSDGAYLSTDASLTENKTVDYSAERMKHILGRYEHNAGTYYKDMLENAAKYDGMELRQMSKLTQNLLKAVDYDRAKKKRKKTTGFSENCFHRKVYLIRLCRRDLLHIRISTLME